MCPSTSKCIFIKKNNMPTKVGLSQPWKWCIYIQKCLRYVENSSYLQHPALYWLTVRDLEAGVVQIWMLSPWGKKWEPFSIFFMMKYFKLAITGPLREQRLLIVLYFEQLLLIHFPWLKILYQFNYQSGKKIVLRLSIEYLETEYSYSVFK